MAHQRSCVISRQNYPWRWAGDRIRGRPEDSLFNSNYTEVWGRVVLISLDCSTLPLIRIFYCWVLSTIFKVFGMTWPGIEPRSPGALANTLPTWTMSRYLIHSCKDTYSALAVLSCIRAGRVSNINGRLDAERPPASAGPPSGGRAASLTPLTPLYRTGPCCPV